MLEVAIAMETTRNRFRRGVDLLSIDCDSVLVPTQRQLKAIVESGEKPSGENRNESLGGG